MEEASTFLNEENMKVIRNTFKEEFVKQENNIRNLKKSKDEMKNLGKEILYVI